MVLDMSEWRRQVHVPAQTTTRVPIPLLPQNPYRTNRVPTSFVLKTKEQRAAEKALMDKSPLKTLTLEDFLENERHKLTGTLTPVTPETFAKWKSERMDKKEAENQARLAKEATGRAMFEKGDWAASGDEEDSDDEEEEEDEAWNMDTLRHETERLREQKEAERIAKAGGKAPSNGVVNVEPNIPEEDEGGEGDAEGEAS